MSLATYSLAAYLRRGKRPSEAAFKYLVLGAISSALLLYGAALLYGATGSTLFAELPKGRGSPLYLAGLALVASGIAFKIAAVPFHAWTPDVYEGAPDAGDRVHGGGREDRRVRVPRPHLPLRRGRHRRAGERVLRDPQRRSPS